MFHKINVNGNDAIPLFKVQFAFNYVLVGLVC